MNLVHHCIMNGGNKNIMNWILTSENQPTDSHLVSTKVVNDNNESSKETKLRYENGEWKTPLRQLSEHIPTHWRTET